MKKSKNQFTKFCIISAGRSGSTLLVTLLDSHPEVRLLGEIFNPKGRTVQNVSDQYIQPFCEYQEFNNINRPWSIFKYLDLLNKYPIPVKAIGFKLIDIELLNYPEILLQIVLHRYKIIHLIRENPLDYYISWAIVKQKLDGKTEVKIDSKIDSVCLNLSDMLPVLNGYEKRITRYKRLLQIIPNSVLTISYEDLVENRKSVISLIMNFLNIQNQDIELISDLKKIAKGTYQEKIANYQEVKDILEATKFNKFLA